MNLAKLYEQVTAVRPDAVVPGLSRWKATGEWWFGGVLIPEAVAIALIGWHWLGLMGIDTSIEKTAAYLIATAKEPT